jgi:tetratricopeptide (TPR) repeat protein
MLFDLRGRGRRRTIQVIYLGLAIVLGGGLILFGVGTGGGNGGLLNAFNPNGGSSAAKAYVSQETKTAEKEVKADPTNAQGWSDLAKAEYQDAGQGLNPSTQSYNAAGKADLQDASKAWQQYLKLAKNPDPTLAQIMAEAYQDLGDYASEAQAWEIAANANPNVAAYWEYVAEDAYLAKETDLGNLAAAKAVKLTPKAQRATLQATLKQAQTQATTTTATPATTG